MKREGGEYNKMEDININRHTGRQTKKNKTKRKRQKQDKTMDRGQLMTINNKGVIYDHEKTLYYGACNLALIHVFAML